MQRYNNNVKPIIRQNSMHHNMTNETNEYITNYYKTQFRANKKDNKKLREVIKSASNENLKFN